MKKLLQINPVVRTNTSTGRIMQEIGELAMANGWESYIAYSYGRDGIKPCKSKLIPVGDKWDVMMHGLATRFLDRHGLASKKATQRFVRQIEEINPDIIHIHNIHGYFLHYPTLFEYLKNCGKHVVWTIHDCWLYTGHCYYYSFAGCNKWQTGCGNCPQQRKFPASWFIDRSAQNFRDKQQAFNSIPHGRMTIVPVSQWMRGEMAHSFLSDADFHVIHNGINTEVFDIQETDAIRQKYNLGSKRILLGLASIWSQEKGLDDLIEMASMLHDDEQMVLVGVDAKTMRRLPANITGITRTENIRQLAELYSAAAVFLNPTYQDNFPTVNMEAIACGTPVVTYLTGGSVETITAETGIVVPQGDVRKMLEAARDIIEKGKSHYQTVCRAYALSHFRKEDRYAEYLELYDKVLNSHTRYAMKILQLGKFYPVRGGVEKVMYDLTLGLSGQSVECHMLCASDSNKGLELQPEPKVKVMCCASLAKMAGTMISPSMVFKAMRICRNYDIIHVHHPDPMACMALFFSRYKGRVVLHWHSDIVKQKSFLKFYKPLQDWLIRRANLVLGTTPVYTAESPCLEKARHKTECLPIGIEPVVPCEEQVEAIRAMYPDKKIVFSLGRMVSYKGFEYLVRAARHLSDDCVVLIGGDGPLRKNLENEILREGVAGKVKLLGRIPDEEVASYFGACDVFCLPSVQKTEAFGIVQIEAMSCGKPVVTTTISGSGVPWVNEDGCSGINVPPRNPQALAEALMAVTADEATYRRFSENALNRYRSVFTKDRMIDRCIELYKSL